MKLAHAGVGFLVGFVLRLVADFRLPEHEGEVADVLRKVGEGEVVGLDLAALEKGEVELVLGLEIVEGEAAEIGDENEAGNLIPAILAGEILDVGEGLGGGEAEVFAAALVLDDQLALPEEVDGGGVAFEVADVFLERGDGGAAQAEDIEEGVVEGLLVRALGRGDDILGIAREAEGAVADFIPGQVGPRQRT